MTKFSIILYCKRHQVLQEDYVSVVDQKEKSVATLHYSKSVAAGQVLRKGSFKSVSYPNNKPIQDGGEAKAPLWLNRLSVTK